MLKFRPRCHIHHKHPHKGAFQQMGSEVTILIIKTVVVYLLALRALSLRHRIGRIHFHTFLWAAFMGTLAIALCKPAWGRSVIDGIKLPEGFKPPPTSAVPALIRTDAATPRAFRPSSASALMRTAISILREPPIGSEKFTAATMRPFTGFLSAPPPSHRRPRAPFSLGPPSKTRMRCR